MAEGKPEIQGSMITIRAMFLFAFRHIDRENAVVTLKREESKRILRFSQTASLSHGQSIRKIPYK